METPINVAYVYVFILSIAIWKLNTFKCSFNRFLMTIDRPFANNLHSHMLCFSGAGTLVILSLWYRGFREVGFLRECTVQITFIFIGQTHLVFGKRVCTCVTKHSNAFQTFLNWLKNSKRVWHERKLHILRLPIFANFDLWSVSVGWV